MDYIEKIADALARAYRRGAIDLSTLRRAAAGQKSRFVEDVGQGFEGITQLRTHPTRGAQVAKIYDKSSAKIAKMHREFAYLLMNLHKY